MHEKLFAIVAVAALAAAMVVVAAAQTQANGLPSYTATSGGRS
jgi:hypothetical protein